MSTRRPDVVEQRTPSPPSRREFALLVGGDVTLGAHYQEFVDEQVAFGRPQGEMVEYGFKNIRPVAGRADLFLVNLECPFTERGTKLTKNFNFRARADLVSTLVAGRVDAVSLANNHLMDYGDEGLTDTQALLDRAGILHFGAGANLSQARKPALVERNQIRVALLGYFFLGDRNIEPKEIFATSSHSGVAGQYDDTDSMERMVRDDIVQAKSRSDLVIPFFHWGREGHHEVEPYQQRLAHAAIDAGAAAVLGSHPHVLQGVELYRNAPIVYSLGNLVFGGNWNPGDKESALVLLRFSKAGYLSSEIIPLSTDHYPQVPLQPSLLEGEDAAQVMRHLAEYSKDFNQTLPQLRPTPMVQMPSPRCTK